MSYASLGAYEPKGDPGLAVPYMPAGSIPPVDVSKNPTCNYAVVWKNPDPSGSFTGSTHLYAVLHANDVAAFQPKVIAWGKAHWATEPGLWMLQRACTGGAATVLLAIEEVPIPPAPPPAPTPPLPEPSYVSDDLLAQIGIGTLGVVALVVGGAYLFTRKK